MKSVYLLAVAALMCLPTLVSADEPVKLMEEVTVVGAVRGSDAVEVADIDLPGDRQLDAIPVAYE